MGMSAIAYGAAVGPRNGVGGYPEDLRLQVCQADMVADRVRRLVLRDPRGRRLPDWTPGSHIDVVLPDHTTRQYSLCGDRWDTFSYQIAVLREPNGRGGSAYIHDTLRVGQLIGIGGPRNHFAMVPAQRYLFIAGGIGITPLLPMIEQAKMLGIEWSLHYGGRSLTSMAFAQRLARHGNCVRLWPRDANGRLPLASAIAQAPAGTKVYCCGPPGLLAAVETLSTALPTGSLRIERFVAPVHPSAVRSTPFEVHLQRSGLTVSVAPDTSVLDALGSVGVTVLSSCRRGVCGTCATDVISGVPDHRDAVLRDDERAKGDTMMPCVSRACSDRLVLDL